MSKGDLPPNQESKRANAGEVGDVDEERVVSNDEEERRGGNPV